MQQALLQIYSQVSNVDTKMMEEFIRCVISGKEIIKISDMNDIEKQVYYIVYKALVSNAIDVHAPEEYEKEIDIFGTLQYFDKNSFHAYKWIDGKRILKKIDNSISYHTKKYSN